jgi:N-acetylglucosamine repressor
VRKIDPFHLLVPIYRRRLQSRIELAKQARVAPSHISVVTREAIKSGLLVEHGSAPSTGGRRRVLLQVNPDVAQLMGIDIGRTNTGIVVTDFAGKVLAHDWFPTVPSRGKEAFLEVLHREVRSRLQRFKKIAGIGVAHSGVVDSRMGKVLFWPMVDGWKDTPLRQIFEDQYGIRVSVDDRVRAMAIAEEWSGHLAGLRNFILVYVGTGIMSAIFFEGHLYGGRDGLAGELGHTTVVENGETCSCGNQGCLERYSSAAAIVGRVRAELERGVASVLNQDLKDNLDGLSVEAIVAAAKSQDRLAERFLSEAGTYLGTALASVVNLLNPERVILTGRVPQASGELLLTPLLYNLRQRAIPQAVNNLPVVVSTLGGEAAGVGISHVAGELYFKACCSGINGLPASLPHATSIRTDSDDHLSGNEA